MADPFAPGAHVVAYLRDSGHEDQEASVDQQESQIREFCLANGLILTTVYADAAAPGSSTIGRDRFLEMIHHFRSPECKDAGVIVWKFSRFARSIDDSQFYKADLRRRGYTIHSLHDQVPDGLDGRFFESAVDWMNARYLEDMSADVIRGQHHLIEQHGALGGTPPRGFTREEITLPPHRDGHPHIVHRWIPNPDLAPLVLQAFSMRASGASYAAINKATRLYKSTNCYETFFKNQLYIGIMRFGDKIILDYCAPIVPREIWDAVQSIQAVSKKAVSTSADHPRRKSTPFLLSGLVFCAQCGSSMDADLIQFRSTAKYRYAYYTCSGRSRHTCSARKVPRAILENTILETIAEIILEPAYLTALYDHQVILRRDQAKTNRVERNRLNSLLTGTRKRIENITNLLADMGTAARSLTPKLKDLEAEETRILNSLNDLEKPLSPLPSIEEIQQQATQLRATIALLENADQISTILHGLISRITISLDEDKTIRGILEYFEPLNAYRASYDALYGPNFYVYTQCPGRDSTYRHKIQLPFSTLVK